ncbi:MAG: hypothetical protein ACYSW7_10670 [Planctomycetota bacterium]
MGKWIGFSIGFNRRIVGDPSSGITALGNRIGAMIFLQVSFTAGKDNRIGEVW